jgi:predicted molibdopterin-dependent oxidoreductase YjgC
MIRLKIDNIDCEVPEGSTLINAAKSMGISIPSLCYFEGLPHYSSCMVCMVKDNKTKGYIPSCSAQAQPGMDIDASGEDVIILRKTAVEFLLSEHRAECEAPCRIVCPAGYNIPLMNRLLAAGEIEKAMQLTISELDSNPIHCKQCAAYCENACRRKKVDNPVSIRNLKLFISEIIMADDSTLIIPENKSEQPGTGEVSRTKSGKKPKRFSSHVGKLYDGELNEWLKECYADLKRYREINDKNSAFYESESCMHCDCRAADDCRLRDLAEHFSLKDHSGKLVSSPLVKKINLQTNLIFENAKCIKCGLCVRLCENLKVEPALCFINRGFVSIISEPLTESFDDILKTISMEVIEICPTGALSNK